MCVYTYVYTCTYTYIDTYKCIDGSVVPHTFLVDLKNLHMQEGFQHSHMCVFLFADTHACAGKSPRFKKHTDLKRTHVCMKQQTCLHTCIHAHTCDTHTGTGESPRPTGSTALKKRHLEAAGMKCIALPYYEIDQMMLSGKQQKIEWLKFKLGMPWLNACTQNKGEKRNFTLLPGFVILEGVVTTECSHLSGSNRRL